MIARLSGEIVEVGPGYMVVSAGGVGYQVFVSERMTMTPIGVGSTINLFTRQVVRENEISLYGFASPSERRLFDLLTSISGLGPRLALGVVASVGEETAVSAILDSDWKSLVKAPGIGQRLAQRICVELADKVREEVLLGRMGAGKRPVADDAVEALVSLGIRRGEAERAVARAREESGTSDVASLIPVALKFAGRGT